MSRAYDIELLFDDMRRNPGLSMNEPGRLTGRHCKARLQRAMAKRWAGRVVKGQRRKMKAPVEPW